MKASSSLLNDDITPAAFWATNPDNHYEHNAAAGGTHFGWWYRLLEHPEGPSATHDICPRHVPLGTVNNNTGMSKSYMQSVKVLLAAAARLKTVRSKAGRDETDLRDYNVHPE